MTYVGTHRRRKVYEAQFVCTRCETEKELVVSARTGVAVTAPRYTYADGYLLRLDGMDRVTFNREIRLEVFGRVAKPRTRRLRAAS